MCEGTAMCGGRGQMHVCGDVGIPKQVDMSLASLMQLSHICLSIYAYDLVLITSMVN